MILLFGAPLKARLEASIQGWLEDGKSVSFHLVGTLDPSVKVYLRELEKECAKLGLPSQTHAIQSLADANAVAALMKAPSDGKRAFVLAKPMPQDWLFPLAQALNPLEDPEMETVVNRGKLLSGDLNCLPATAKAALSLLKTTNIDPIGKSALVVGRSTTVGLPLALGLERLGFLVTIAHSKVSRETVNRLTKTADVLALATGKTGLIDPESLRPCQVILDCGFDERTHKGDLGFVPPSAWDGWVTPVPKGIGPVTIVEVIANAFWLSWGVSL